MYHGREQRCLALHTPSVCVYACVCECVHVVLGESVGCKLYKHSGLQEPITCCFPSKMGMLLLLQYLELTQTSATSREEQASSKLVFPDCFDNPVPTTA